MAKNTMKNKVFNSKLSPIIENDVSYICALRLLLLKAFLISSYEVLE